MTHHRLGDTAYQQMANTGATVAAHHDQLNLILLGLNDNFIGGAAKANIKGGRDRQGGNQLFELGSGLTLHLVSDLDGRHMKDLVTVKTVQLINHVDQLELGLMALCHENGIVEYRARHLGKIDWTEQNLDRWHNAVSSTDWGAIESLLDHNDPTANNPRPCRKMEMRDVFSARRDQWHGINQVINALLTPARIMLTMLRIGCLLLCSLCAIVHARTTDIHVYCDGWPGFCQPDGRGIYLDLVRTIYQPHGYQIVPHIMPYKRAVAMVARQEGDMAMSVYRDEVKGAKQPRQPASADDVTVFMLKQWQPQWRGERSLEGETVLWRRGWVLDKYLPVTMRWHEIDSHEMALQLIGKGRYRYYLTAGVLHAADETPANMYRTILRWIPTYPIFTDTEQGERLLQLWDQEMVNLIRRGTLVEIYRRYHLYDYYRDFLEEQAVKAGEN